MKSKKPKKSKKAKKIKLDLFQEVCFKPKSAEMAMLVFVCTAVFGVSSLASGKLLYDHNQEKIRSILSSQPQIQIVKSAAAAENEINENSPVAEEEVSAEDDALVKAQAEKAARAKSLARQRAAETARILSGPVPTGKTSRMPDGRRECTTKSLHPQRGGKIHVDEDCCADYNETPNPRCYYPPNKMAILKH
jgi:hypothetical protein